MLTRICLAALFLASTFYALAQAPTPLPLQPEAWDNNGLPLSFITYRGVPALRLGAATRETRDEAVTLRDFVFRDGTLEFDYAMEDSSFFAAVHFRRFSTLLSEHFYLRTFFAGQTNVNEACQYAAVVDGVNYWDLSPDFQAAVRIDSSGWNHVKLVVRGEQLLAYVNDMTRPALYVPRMDAAQREGQLGFAGLGVYANLSYSPATEGLAGEVGYDPTLGDGRYLRAWQHSAPRSIAKTRALSTLQLPADTVAFRPIAAERRGLLNLSRPFGKTDRDDRRLVWLRTTLHAAEARTVLTDVGYTDELAIWVNGELAYTGENNYGTPQMKYPKGRASLDNAHFSLPLRRGDNEVIVALANDFFGWGMLMRLREPHGLSYE